MLRTSTFANTRVDAIKRFWSQFAHSFGKLGRFINVNNIYLCVEKRFILQKK
jgi:hypothetical protein